jgi:hypothetical protein
MKPLPQTIEEVLIELDTIIEESISRKDYLAIFTYVYRRTTAQIKTEIEKGSFEDTPRMEQFDVVFANRYLLAHRQFMAGRQSAASWLVPFKARFESLTNLQHLIMGMNAHIIFDLGIAAADIAPGDQINDLENDFMKVNDILAELVDEVQLRLAKASPAMFLLDLAGGRKDEKIINFSIRGSRQMAWSIAKQVAVLEGREHAAKIKRVDEEVARLNNHLRRPRSRLIRSALRMIRFLEESDVERIIDFLSAELKEP